MSFSKINGLIFVRMTGLKLMFLIFVVSFLYSNSAKAQQVNANVKLDSTTILIGGQLDMQIELSQPTGVTVDFPQLTDTITKEIEIVDKGGIDTTKLDNNRIVLSQTIRITCFDSGLHYIPPMFFELHKDDFKQTIQSNELSLRVVNPFKEVNPQKGIFDIKGIKKSPFILAEILNYIYIIGGSLILIALIIWLIYRYRSKRKSGDMPAAKVKSLDPPDIVAIRELDKIKAEKLWEHDRIKEFYTRVSDTLRDYIEQRYHIQALEQTSEEILYELKKQVNLDKEIYSNIKQVFELSDLVKFAKFKPLPDENGLSLMNAYSFIEKTKEKIIKSLEEEKERMVKENEKSEDQKDKTT